MVTIRIKYSTFLLSSICFYLSWWIVNPAIATETPKIRNFTQKEYQAAAQNWMISQTKDGRIFVANTDGLLEYDGTRWWQHFLPKKQVCRVVKVKDDRIYVGGYEEMGYWKKNKEGKLQYNSLSPLAKESEIINQDIWHVEIIDEDIYFQSFSRVFRYRPDEGIKSYRLPNNFMLGKAYQGKYILPGIGTDLYALDPEGNVDNLAPIDLDHNDRIAAVAIHPEGNLLIGSENTGLFYLVDQQLMAINNATNELLKKAGINRILPLSNGWIAFGTIHEGVIITDQNYNLLYTVNKSNGLQNNTVLSLMEDQNGDLWVGLDKGISLLGISLPLSFYNDVDGKLGTVFCAMYHKGYEYLGTNQGLFYKTEELSDYHLIPGTEGPVWELVVMDNQLICGHNNGTYLIERNQITKISDVTGAWHTIRHPLHDSLLLQSTYTGLVVLAKHQGKWRFDHRVPNSNLGFKKLVVDKDGRIWGQHIHKGLHRIVYPSLHTGIKPPIHYGVEYGLPESSDTEIKLYGGSLLLLIEQQPYLYSDNAFVKAEDINVAFSDIYTFDQDTFFINKGEITFKNKNIRFLIPMDFDRIHHQISQYRDSTYLITQNDSYAILNINSLQKNTENPREIIVRISTDDGPFYHIDSFSDIALEPYHKNLKIFASVPDFHNSGKLILENTSDHYNQQFDKDGELTLVGLPKGSHKLTISSADVNHSALSFGITVLPKWYETWWAWIIYVLVIILIIYLLYQVHLQTIAKEKEILLAEQNRLRKQQQIINRNKQLQNEIQLKSSQLADSTMTLVKKNELLTELKTKIKPLKKEIDNDGKNVIQKLIHLINRNISSDEDWHLFEQNFNAVHEDFLKRLKKEYPHLTPGDLRLAAYLKMDLSTKEIAPLLNISIRSVENKRYRLRKKLHLNPEDNLASFMIQY